MNETACYVERQPGHDPNDKEKYRQNEEKEVSQGGFTLTGWTAKGEKTCQGMIADCFKRGRFRDRTKRRKSPCIPAGGAEPPGSSGNNQRSLGDWSHIDNEVT